MLIWEMVIIYGKFGHWKNNEKQKKDDLNDCMKESEF